MQRPYCFDTVSQEMSALAGSLKTRRVRRALKKTVKRGQSPVLSLSAAISASLVSAAAKEGEYDPLAGLVAVDDLSAFGEDCLPADAYAEVDDHDHESAFGSSIHAGHREAAYLDDPFASRFESKYATSHNDHQAPHPDDSHAVSVFGASHPAHESGVGAAGAANHSDHDQHQSRLSVERGGHAHDSIPVADETDHQHRDIFQRGAQSAHATHSANHDAPHASGHAGHVGSPPVTMARAVHAPAETHGHTAETEVEDAADEISQLIDALSPVTLANDRHVIDVMPAQSVKPVAETAGAMTAPQHGGAHDHGMHAFDTAPVVDLTLAAVPPVI